MVRTFHLSPVYDTLRLQIEKLLLEMLKERAADALVHVGMSAYGRMHLLVVSDALASKGTDQAEEWLWERLEASLPESSLELISVLQILSVADAIAHRGPADMPILVQFGAQLMERWGTIRGESADVADDALIKDTRAWVETAMLQKLSFTGRDLLEKLPKRSDPPSAVDSRWVHQRVAQLTDELANVPDRLAAA